MDALIDLFMLLVFHWRLGLSVVGTTVLAIFLAATLPWFSGAFGLALVIGSVGLGLLWEGAADKNRAERVAKVKEGR
ncbi:hypothetical protein [Pseudorhodoferax soli]|uniref:Uncharacterized protein n=1 Tax=Pseudorhodoferax soli TaxID=545864 RepID=A0A368XRJ9_9BURK|nr:hypothetical protein [Pseudorhodoferax soli]RCW70505.1 hypothetical protein DES41_105448 [Pseudorhodoferax soli]